MSSTTIRGEAKNWGRLQITIAKAVPRIRLKDLRRMIFTSIGIPAKYEI
jgi:hypothetical protein